MYKVLECDKSGMSRLLRRDNLIRVGIAAAALVLSSQATAFDDNDNWKNSPLREWFDSLASNKGNCCSIAEGHEVTYTTQGNNYVVLFKGKKYIISDDDGVVLKRPNLYGRAVIWFDKEGTKEESVRCFLPNTGT